MPALEVLIKRHPVAAYFVLTFAISWGGVLAVVGPGGFPGTPEAFETLMAPAVLAMIAGPSVAGILMTGLVHGKAGLRELLSRLLRWRVGARWYAAALLTAPLAMLAVLVPLSRFSPEFLPALLGSGDKFGVLLFAIAVALAAGIVEELGWTGFAIPALLPRYGILATGLLVGLPWAAWHVLVAFWGSGAVQGELSRASYLIDPFFFLTAFRVLMVWLYDRTGSLLLAMLMHLSLTASARLFMPPAIAGVPLLTFDVLWFAAVWIVIAAIAVANGGRLSRQPLRTRLD